MSGLLGILTKEVLTFWVQRVVDTTLLTLLRVKKKLSWANPNVLGREDSISSETILIITIVFLMN